ncbi:hypothetical protein FZW96_21000 [Bacillus sp. BGMRC 2118]|nr:hypothetical protein FZW96_21000 [Bacillus sp. BGMRC 2118]
MALKSNPTKEDYNQFFESKVGEPISLSPKLEIERINFFVFSTYTPAFVNHEHGITHLGVFNHFIPISDGQYDYPVWLEPFH